MPFLYSYLNHSKKRSVTLQVRILLIKKQIKKGSFFASASLTLEAALALPLYLYAGAVFLTLFQVMDTHRQVQAAAEYVSEQIGQTAYVSKYMDEETVFGPAAAYGYAELTMRTKLKGLPVKGVSLARSNLLKDGETIDLMVDYELSMPFSVLGRRAVKLTNRSFRRAWVGRDGQQDGSEAGNYQDNAVVYVGKNSTRYHIDRTCHYLYNDLTAVDIADIEEKRSQDGRRYGPCARCGHEPAGTVYIMPSGEHYHTRSSCSAISSYVRTAIKSEVEYLGACSYCSGTK